MKKAFTQTIIVFVAVNLMMASSTLAQNVTEEESQPASKEAVVAEKEIELERKKAEIVAKVAEKEAEVARKQFEVAQKQMAIAQEHASHDMLLGTLAAQVSMPVWQHSSGGAVLVIPTAEMKIDDLAMITEDMTVMSRIFDKKLSQARLTTGGAWPIGSDLMLFGRSRSSGAIEAIYLEGYGALFLIKVNVLLSPPPETQQEKETEEEDTDPLWTETIQEMYAPQKVSTRRRRGERPEEKYDAEKVEDLKETLIKTLKHAANIRNLKPDESVILTVIGKAGQSATFANGRLYREPGSSYILSDALLVSGKTVFSNRAGTGFSSPAVLTIRAKKSDIDAFAKGQLSFDQFTQKTLLLSYSYLGENIGGGPPPSSPINTIYGERITRRSPR
jgi:hypothetical protein